MNKRWLSVCLLVPVLLLAAVLVYFSGELSETDSQQFLPDNGPLETSPVAQDTQNSLAEETGSLAAVERMIDLGDIHRHDRWELINALSPAEIPEAFSLLQQLPEGRDKALLLEGLFKHWRASDPHGAAAASEAIFARDTRENIQFGVMGALSNTDPEAAFVWLQKNPEWDDRFGRIMVRQVVLAGMREDSAETIAKFAAIESPALRREAGRIWAGERAAQVDPSMVFEELYTLRPGSEEQAGSAERLIGVLIEQGELEQAQTLVAGVAADHPVRSPALRTLAETFLASATAMGLEYVGQLTPGADRDAVIEDFTYRWTETVLTETHGTGANPAMVTAAMADPAGETAALTGYYTALGRYDPEAALAAAVDLPPEHGLRVIESTLTIWSVIDREAMHELLDQSRLSSNHAQTFRERFPILSEDEKSEQFAF